MLIAKKGKNTVSRPYSNECLRINVKNLVKPFVSNDRSAQAVGYNKML